MPKKHYKRVKYEVQCGMRVIDHDKEDGAPDGGDPMAVAFVECEVTHRDGKFLLGVGGHAICQIILQQHTDGGDMSLKLGWSSDPERRPEELERDAMDMAIGELLEKELKDCTVIDMTSLMKCD